MRLVLIRHGETTWNVEGRYQGRRDAPLSARGIEQARALKPILAGFSGIFVSSPLSRARETFRHALGADARSVAVDVRLTEIAHGVWEGLLRDDVQARFPDLWRGWRETPDLVSFPGGESLADVDARLRAFIRDAETEGEALAISTHDVVVRLAVLAAQGRPLAEFNDVAVDNASVSDFELAGGRLTALRINATEHLGSLRGDLSGQAL